MKKIRYTSLAMLLSAAAIVSSCSQDKTTALDKVRTLQKQYAANPADKDLAAKLDAAIKEYHQKQPDDTANARLLFQSAQLNQTVLGHTDQALVQLRQVYDGFPAHTLAPNALYLAGYLYETSLQDTLRAHNAYRLLIKKYPEHVHAKEAKVILEHSGMSDDEMLDDILRKNGGDSSKTASPGKPL